VTFRYHDHIGWNSPKIISRPNSLRPMKPTWAIWCNGNTPKIRVEYEGWGQEHTKAVITPKWCKIGPRLLLRTNRKSHMRFRLAPNSSNLDDLERPKRPLAELKSSYGAHRKNFNENRPISLVGKCRLMRILARNIKCMRICAGVTSERVIHHIGY